MDETVAVQMLRTTEDTEEDVLCRDLIYVLESRVIDRW
jgi:hypothetical protein